MEQSKVIVKISNERLGKHTTIVDAGGSGGGITITPKNNTDEPKKLTVQKK